MRSDLVPSERAPSWRRVLAASIWLGRHELATLFMLTSVACGVWLFLAIAGRIGTDAMRACDERLFLLLRNPANHSDPFGPPWVGAMMRAFTEIGAVEVLCAFVAMVVGFLLWKRKLHAAFLISASVGGAIVLTYLLKHGYDRPRPGLVPHGSDVTGPSFPSGHATLAAATYFTLGAFVARAQPRRLMKAFVLLIAAVLTGLVAVSRVYLGVHWPSDVLAGVIVGSGWALLCWTIARTLQRHGLLGKNGDTRRRA